MNSSLLQLLEMGKNIDKIYYIFRLIISTPTGSTAYNLAAGGSIVQSNVPAILLTPIAPHSLSFRPLILPESCTIKLTKPDDGRTSAWVSLDGATRFELKSGESLVVRASKNAVAFVTDPVEDITAVWSCKLTRLLNWNVRKTMKSLKRKDIENEGYGSKTNLLENRELK